jgi:hypothetical protein
VIAPNFLHCSAGKKHGADLPNDTCFQGLSKSEEQRPSRRRTPPGVAYGGFKHEVHPSLKGLGQECIGWTLRAENDKAVAQLYGLTEAELAHLRHSFKVMTNKRPKYVALLQQIFSEIGLSRSQNMRKKRQNNSNLSSRWSATA